MDIDKYYNSRADGIDLFRGLGVVGFIFWHSFDMLYGSIRYDAPYFRLLLFTTGTFVAVSGLTLGLVQKKRPLLFRYALAKYIRLLAFPSAVGVAYAVAAKSFKPILEVITYPFGTPGTFTFSILVVLGSMSITLPFIPFNRIPKLFTIGFISTLGLVELFNGALFSPFMRLFVIGVLCFLLNRPLLMLLSERFSNWQFTILCLWTITIFITVFISPYLYWYIRSRIIPYSLIVLTLGVFVVQAFSRYPNTLSYIRRILLVFGKNSLFVYIFHYVVLSSVTILVGNHLFGSIGVVTAGVGLTVLCFLITIKILPVMCRNRAILGIYRIVFGNLLAE